MKYFYNMPENESKFVTKMTILKKYMKNFGELDC